MTGPFALGDAGREEYGDPKLASWLEQNTAAAEGCAFFCRAY